MHYDEDVGAAFCYTTHRCKMLMNSIAKERISHAYLLEGGKVRESLRQQFKWQRVSSVLSGME